MGDTKKNLRPLGHLESLPLAPLKMALTHVYVKKKKTQKLFLKKMHRVSRYYQKSVKNQPSKPNQQNFTHFGRYLGTDFCVETVSLSQLI